MKPQWRSEPDDHDFKSAESYLSLIADPDRCEAAMESLKSSEISQYAAKDVIRASGLSLLPTANSQVSKDLKRIRKGKKLSPVLLVRGGKRLVIADGYHRICAVYYNGEDDMVAARVGNWN